MAPRNLKWKPNFLSGAQKKGIEIATLDDILRYSDWTVPTGKIAQSFPRNVPLSNTMNYAQGTLLLVGVPLVAGVIINNITFRSGSQGVTSGALVNQWFSLYSPTRNLLGVTNDDTSTAWNANSPKTLNLTAPVTIQTSGIYYAGLVVANSTTLTLCTTSNSSTGVAQAVNGQAQALVGYSNNALTVPLTAPAVANAPAGASNIPYVLLG